ncbi:hypothetical protein [Cupriavidus numazuensis]|uniref:Uncharacterized protein n=1 Tax=Cupriavidus numazuensis TaxID=221992 RepID=A0ABN7Q0D3_9BURK|nr:hypothetical protein [Cupriavidus numazuensis]CAG2144322.1 hypothetical protein LMG26411_02550 [Cupriavidus numazuensis]
MNAFASFTTSRSPLSGLLQVATVLVAVAAWASPVPALSQTASSDDGNEALHNIQSNFARMTPPPRTVESINQELKAGEVKAHASSAGGHRGGGRRGMGRQSAQQGDSRQDGNGGPGTGSAEVPADGLSGNTASSVNP